MRVRYTVRYQVATYSGTVAVFADEDAETDTIIALAKRELARNAPLPFGCQSFHVVRSDR